MISNDLFIITILFLKVEKKGHFIYQAAGKLGFLLMFCFMLACSQPQKKGTGDLKIDNAKLLMDLSTKVYADQQSKALQYALEALDLSRKNNDPASEAFALTTIADISLRQGFYRKAQNTYFEVLEYYKKVDNKPMLNSTYQNIGDTYYRLNINDSAINYYNRALKGFQDSGDRLGIGNCYLKIGNNYWITNNFDKSLEYYINTLKIYETYNYQIGIAKVYVNIGLIYFVTDNYENAFEYLRKARTILEDHYDIDILGDLYYRMGDIYSKKNNFNIALAYYDSSLVVLDSVSNNPTKAWVLRAKSNALKGLNKNKEAISIAEEALKTGEIYDNKWFHASMYNTLGLLQISEYDFRDALQYLNKAEEIANKLDAWPLKKENYEAFSNYYQATGDFRLSLDYYKKYQIISDSILHKNRNERIMQLQTRYDAEKNKKELIRKEAEIKLNQKKLERQKLQLYLFSIGVLIVLFLSIALYRQYKIIENKGKKIERINEELDQRVKERTSALRLTQYSVDQSSDPIFWISLEGNYVFANKSACEKLEYSKEELSRLSITDVIPNFNPQDWIQFWEIIKKEKSLSIESLHKKRSGKTFPVEIILNYVAHEGNEYAFSYVRDISERKQKEENLKKAKEKAEEADKLKSAFLANMSHEIRTPMNAIIGFSDLIVHEDYTLDEKKEFGNLIKNSGTSLLKLIDDIIDISIMESGHLKLNKSSIHVNTHLNEIILFFQEEKARLGKNVVNLILNTPENSDKIFMNTDVVRFRQVINNLVGNALKFTETGIIELGYEIGNDPVLHFFVKDSGIGIRPEKINLIFERFHKLSDEKRVYAGTGLGLTISKKIIEELGGFMYVESEYGKGSKFSFTLPYYSSSYVKNEGLIELDLPRENAVLNWENKRIMIVEDVSSNYLFLETILQKTRVQLTWAKTGKQAVEMVKKVKPDLILMDIQLPELSGYEATRQIRLVYPQIPIIAQTAYAFAGEKEKIIASGCNDYITKPIKPKDLIDLIENYMIG